jgi:hypothetical protein
MNPARLHLPVRAARAANHGAAMLCETWNSDVAMGDSRDVADERRRKDGEMGRKPFDIGRCSGGASG